MARAHCGAVLVISMLAAPAVAQGPPTGPVSNAGLTAPAPMATLGEPQAQPASPAPPGAGTIVQPAGAFTGSYSTLPRPLGETVPANGPGALPASWPEGGCPQGLNPWLDNMSLFIGFDG